MKISIFTLADYVTEQNGKLVIVGSFDNWLSSKFPFNTPPFGIAIKGYIEDSDYGKEKAILLELKLHGTKDKIFEARGTIQFPAKTTKKVKAAITIFMVSSISIEKPGMYEIECKIENKVQSSFPVEVVDTGTSKRAKKAKKKAKKKTVQKKAKKKAKKKTVQKKAKKKAKKR